MNKRPELVFRGFLVLSDSDKSEFIEALLDYGKQSQYKQIELAEVYKSRRIVLGPLSGDVCPCCGR